MGTFPQTYNNPTHAYISILLLISFWFLLVNNSFHSSTLPEDHALMTLEWYPVLSEFLQMRVKIGM